MAKSILPYYKKLAFVGIITVTFGVIFSTSLGDQLGGLSSIFIAIGALLLISSMVSKKKENEQNHEEL